MDIRLFNLEAMINSTAIGYYFHKLKRLKIFWGKNFEDPLWITEMLSVNRAEIQGRLKRKDIKTIY